MLVSMYILKIRAEVPEDDFHSQDTISASEKLRACKQIAVPSLSLGILTLRCQTSVGDWSTRCQVAPPGLVSSRYNVIYPIQKAVLGYVGPEKQCCVRLVDVTLTYCGNILVSPRPFLKFLKHRHT